MKFETIIISLIILIIIIIIIFLSVFKINSEIYDYLKQDCENNNGVLWTYSGCQKTYPFTKSNCEFEGGYVCHLPNGTKYQKSQEKN